MPTLPTTTRNDGRPSRGDLAYILARNQSQAHTLMVRCVKESHLSQKELAILTGIDEATLSRTLTRPRNVELNTVSKIVFAACGASIKLSLAYPGEKSKSGAMFLGRIDIDGRSLSNDKLFYYRLVAPHHLSDGRRVVTTSTASSERHVALETGENRILEVSSAGD